MRAFDTLLTVYLLIVGVSLPQTVRSKDRQVSGVVETLDGKRLSHVTIRITNVGGTTTSDSGEFTLELPPSFVPGQPIEFSLLGDWVISSPWEGRSFVPVFGAEAIHVRVGRKGDPRFLADSDFVASVVTGVTSELKPLLTPNGEGFPARVNQGSYLASKADQLGLTVDELKSAINQWISEARGPYQRGLAALYAKRFNEASEFMRQSIASSEGELLPKYLALANAEREQGHFPDAESALRRLLAIQPENPQALYLLRKPWAPCRTICEEFIPTEVKSRLLSSKPPIILLLGGSREDQTYRRHFGTPRLCSVGPSCEGGERNFS
jgi:tetratricopeptide repeat protein